MPIRVTCPSCSASFTTADANAGKRGKCPKCSESLVVPAAARSDEPVRPPAVERPRRAAPPGGSRRRRREALPNVEDLAEPQAGLPPLAIGAAAIVAVAGAVLWTLVAFKFEYEIGWIAWAIGVGVGSTAAALGGRGPVMAVIAAALTLLGIAGGKLAAIHLAREQIVEQAVEANTQRTLYAAQVNDAKDWQRLGKDASDEELAEFMSAHDYPEEGLAPPDLTAEDLADFREWTVPLLEEFHAETPPFEEWRDDQESGVRAALDQMLSLQDLFVQSLGSVAVVFALLGIGTAYGLVMRRSA